MISVEKPGSPAEVLEHVGVKGMHWGVRKAVDTAIGTKTAGRRPGSYKTKSKAITKQSKPKRVGIAAARVGKSGAKRFGRAVSDVGFALNSQNENTHLTIATKATDRLIRDLPRIQAKHGEYGKLSNRTRHPFHPAAKAYRADVKATYLRHLERSANEITNKRGDLQYTLSEHGKPNTSQYLWNVSARRVAHAADGTGDFTVHPVFDAEGYIVKLEIVGNTMAQTVDRGLNFLIHMDIIEA